jgi:hypothetical protein
MAEIPKVTVAVESAVYGALNEVLQAIQDQHGIVVDRVCVCWLDVSVVGVRPRSVITQISIESRQKFSDIPR